MTLSSQLAVTYGEADLLLLMDDGETEVWSASASMLGRTITVSLLIAGRERFVNTFEAFKPEVTVQVQARAPGGDWVPCQRKLTSRGGVDNLTLLGHIFDAPTDPADELRLE